MKQAARRAPATGADTGDDDDCPLCRLLREHGDPDTREVITLPDGSTIEIQAVGPHAPRATRG
ncbi:MAG TPA: hypothetical protein VLB44_16005 [Kofleriaceae bacterium]|nr:hypothetical protein [Kofleriaceae bacterium]